MPPPAEKPRKRNDMPGAFKDLWNEFDWEAELKKDDERVAAYIQELPRYIDLPAEDAVIMKHIQERPGLVPSSGDYSGAFPDSIFEDGDEESGEEDLADDWQKRDGAEFFLAAGRLARLWALYFAAENAPEIQKSSLRILCFYGKIMARSGDLIDMDDDEYPALRIAVAKRLLADINTLMGEFRRLAEKWPTAEKVTDFHLENLMIFRDKILALLKKYRAARK